MAPFIFPPFQIQYWCRADNVRWNRDIGFPLDVPIWKGSGSRWSLDQAIDWAWFVRPPRGAARILDARGVVVWEAL
jgi:hypothetical protein